MAEARPRGRYIVLEGPEGVGKTTQVARLVERLRSQDVEAVAIREPGGDPFAEAGRALLLGDLPRHPETEVLVFNALRTQVMLSRVLPAVEDGRWVVSDRGALSTLAYQGHALGADLDWARQVAEAVAAVFRPDLVLVLELAATEADRRRAARGTTDRFEGLPADFHRRVAAGYATEAARARLPVVDGSGAPDDVADRVWKVVGPLLG